jgi:hypothetical protein
MPEPPAPPEPPPEPPPDVEEDEELATELDAEVVPEGVSLDPQARMSSDVAEKRTRFRMVCSLRVTTNRYVVRAVASAKDG